MMKEYKKWNYTEFVNYSMSIFSRLCAEVRVHIVYLFNVYFEVEISIKSEHWFDSDKDMNDKD